EVDSKMPTAQVSEENLTSPGTALGTVAYMSPEQARGEELDARTDLFSLGVVLYEMATGSLPFQGNTTAVVFTEILTKAPVAPVRINPNVSDDLERTINKALEKDTEVRCQSAKDFLADLKRLKRDSTGESVASTQVAAVAPAKKSYLWPAVAGVAVVVLLALALFWSSAPALPDEAINSIAVLPFENASGDPDLEYLSDGITESLINSLSGLPGLRVVPRGMVFPYKGKQVDLQTIGDELRVQAVVTGRMTQRGDSVAVGAELTDVVNLAQIWGNQYSQKSTEFLALHKEITEQITESLRFQLGQEEREQLASGITGNPEAYQAYLRGRYHWNKRNREGFNKAVEYFQEAIDQDPAYARAYSGLADAYAIGAYWDFFLESEALPLARAAAEKALEINEGLAEAHTSLAWILIVSDLDWASAEREFKKSLELNPDYATAHQWYAQILMAQRRFKEGIAEARKAKELDPLSLQIRMSLGSYLLMNQQTDDAVEELQQILELDPDYINAHWALRRAYVIQGLYEDAATHAEIWESLRQQVSEESLALRHLASGRRAEAQGVVDDAQGIDLMTKAHYYVLFNEPDKALESLTQALTQGHARMTVVNAQPWFDPLRDDPRFTDLLRRMNLEP
ncbi:MAG: tetratricopeptide repeat protein, partial [Acidobacteriota bacterium]